MNCAIGKVILGQRVGGDGNMGNEIHLSEKWESYSSETFPIERLGGCKTLPSRNTLSTLHSQCSTLLRIQH